MDWTWYLFSFNGRINRAKWWLAELVLIGWQLFCSIAYFGLWLAAHAFLPDENIGQRLGTDEISVLIGRLLDGSFSLVDLVALAANLFAVATFFWMFLATAIKRLHDRDRSGWWIVPFLGLLSFSSNIQEWLGESIFTFPVDLALFVLCIWGIIELGFLQGSPGDNRFGPNPLGKQQGRPRGEPKSGISTSGQDQTSELEFASHSGSPPPGMHVKRGHD